MDDLTAPYDVENVFAKILRGDLPALKLYEDEHSLSFMDIMPQAEGHVLVIPKSPGVNLLTLDSHFLAPMMATTQRMAVAVQAAMNCPGILVAQLNGSAAGQTVFHIHMHIVPRYDGVDLQFHAVAMADMDDLARIADKIRANI